MAHLPKDGQDQEEWIPPLDGTEKATLHGTQIKDLEPLVSLFIF
jgi:hypothetical protein